MDAKLKETILNPIFKGNPITVLVLGICSSLAVTVTLKGALVMTLSVIVVTGISSLILSLLPGACFLLAEFGWMLIFPGLAWLYFILYFSLGRFGTALYEYRQAFRWMLIIGVSFRTCSRSVCA